MIRPVTWPSLIRARVHAHYGAALATRVCNDAVCALIDRQAHARLCWELRAFADRVREVPHV